MIRFLTEYWIGTEFYSSHIYAESFENAKEIAIDRGLGEVVLGRTKEMPPNKNKNNETLLHEVAFASYLALKSQKVSVDQILGDRGVLHELIHKMDNSFDENTSATLSKKIDWLFSVVPGFRNRDNQTS